jgi:hypothetical protein
MVLLVLLVVVPFGVVVVVANTLLAMCEPKTRLGAVICFVVPIVAVLSFLPGNPAEPNYPGNRRTL